MNNKQRLEMLLRGEVPDIPPHFELVFQLEKEVFGIDWEPLRKKEYASKAERQNVLLGTYIEICLRLIEEFNWAAVPGWFYDEEIDQFESIAKVKEAVGDKALVFAFSEKGVYWMPTSGDIMDFVIMLFERPDEMHTNARAKCEAAKELSQKQVDAGVDFIIQNTDFGFNSGPFISPKHFKEFVTPYMAEIIEVQHDLGTKVIVHSDGDLRDILDQIHSTGVDGFQSVDPQANMDIKAVRETYPDWLLMGNVACNLMQDPDEEKIRESVRYCMEHGGKGKRYIFSTSNCIFAGMPPENYRVMLNEYTKLCNANAPMNTQVKWRPVDGDR